MLLKHRLKREGSQVVTNCNGLKWWAPDGKAYLTDVANTETLLRLVQSVPSLGQNWAEGSDGGEFPAALRTEHGLAC
jgi:hypothetical protein